MRVETAMLGLGWGAEVQLTRTPFLDGLIGQGRLTVLEEFGADQLAGGEDGELPTPAGSEPADAPAPAAEPAELSEPEEQVAEELEERAHGWFAAPTAPAVPAAAG